jgi:hypothetical protein
VFLSCGLEGLSNADETRDCFLAVALPRLSCIDWESFDFGLAPGDADSIWLHGWTELRAALEPIFPCPMGGRNGIGSTIASSLSSSSSSEIEITNGSLFCLGDPGLGKLSSKIGSTALPWTVFTEERRDQLVTKASKLLEGEDGLIAAFRVDNAHT